MTSEVLPNLVNLQEAVDAALAKFDVEDFARRVWKKDASLWTANPTAGAVIDRRLGWLDLPAAMQGRGPDLLDLAQTVKDEGYRQVVLLAADQSSLAALVLQEAFGNVSGYPALVILDPDGNMAGSNKPERLDYQRTLFVISSTGGTLERLEPLISLFERESGRSGENFIAITNPGTPLERLARERDFREIFLNPPGIGGLYLALSFPGLVPAALAGYNVREMLSRASIMAEECHKPGLDNPGLHLGCILGSAGQQTRLSPGLVLGQPLEGFALWADRLLETATGRGFGLVADGEDEKSLVVCLQLSGQLEESLKKLEAAAHPVVRLRLQDLADLAAEFFRWEFAVLVAAAVLGKNPFE